MVYKVIGIMSGSSLDGLDIALVHLREIAGKWSYEIKYAACYNYANEMVGQLRDAIHLSALEYQLLNTSYGRYIGKQVNSFIEQNDLTHQVDLIVSHGHTTFHLPAKSMTAQLGDGASIAAETLLPVVTDLRAMDVAFGGQGAPIVPIGEELLFPGFDYFLNLGGIANITVKVKTELQEQSIIAFDVCAANRVLNMLSLETGLKYDDEGMIAASGNVHVALLQQLNDLDYYKQPYPKSLDNNFGTDIIYPIIKSYTASVPDALRTYVEHIALQVTKFIAGSKLPTVHRQLLITGGGAFNKFLVEMLKANLSLLDIEAIIPDADIINYKEALIMALIGTLRWREEYTVLNSATGARRKSIGGALWLGTEA